MVETLFAGTLAKMAVDFIFPKVADGALQAVGGDAYKAGLKKIKGFFAYKFGEHDELETAESNPDALVALVTRSLENDDDMAKELSKLVSDLQKISAAASPSSQVTQGDNSNSLIGQNSTIIEDSNVDQSRTSFEHINVTSGQDSGDVNIGNRGDSFRG